MIDCRSRAYFLICSLPPRRSFYRLRHQRMRVVCTYVRTYMYVCSLTGAYVHVQQLMHVIYSTLRNRNITLETYFEYSNRGLRGRRFIKNSDKGYQPGFMIFCWPKSMHKRSVLQHAVYSRTIVVVQSYVYHKSINRIGYCKKNIICYPPLFINSSPATNQM